MFPRQIQSQLAKNSGAVTRNGASITNSLNQNLNTQFQLQQVRFKRDKAAINVNLQRVVNQLSVMSANRKQPKLLRLSKEDYVKHLTIRRAWSIERSRKKEANEEQLRKQYESITLANEELKQVSESLYDQANVREHGKRFPLEMRVPTQYPPRNIWFHDYTPIVYKKQVK